MLQIRSEEARYLGKITSNHTMTASVSFFSFLAFIPFGGEIDTPLFWVIMGGIERISTHQLTYQGIAALANFWYYRAAAFIVSFERLQSIFD